MTDDLTGGIRFSPTPRCSFVAGSELNAARGDVSLVTDLVDSQSCVRSRIADSASLLSLPPSLSLSLSLSLPLARRIKIYYRICVFASAGLALDGLPIFNS